MQQCCPEFCHSTLAAVKAMANARNCRLILVERCGNSCLLRIVSQSFPTICSEQLTRDRCQNDQSLSIITIINLHLFQAHRNVPSR